MLDKDFELLKKTTGEISFDERTAPSVLQKIPQKYQTFLDILSVELMELNALKAQKENLYGKIYIELKEKGRRELSGKHEFDAYINSNGTFHDLCVKIFKQEVIIRYLEETLSNIKSLSYNIKNYLDYKKFYAGER